MELFSNSISLKQVVLVNNHRFLVGNSIELKVNKSWHFGVYL